MPDDLIQETVRAVGKRLLETHGTAPHYGWASEALGVPDGALASHVSFSTPYIARSLTSLLETEATRFGVELKDAHDPSRPAATTTLRLSSGGLDLAGESLSAWPAGTLARVPLVLRLSESDSSRWRFETLTRDHEAGAGSTAVGALIVRSREDDSPFRSNHLRASSLMRSLNLKPLPYPTATRSQLRLPQQIWEEIDVNIHRHLRRAPVMADLGLGRRRGLLLHGPPGTGKTHLTRVVVAEVAGKATTIVADRLAMTECMLQVYKHAADLAPSIVILEDIDVIAAHRSGSANGVLQELLTALDGPLTRDRTVITIATTNDVTALDPAAIRAARFDRIIEVPRPNMAGRRMILHRYVGALHEHDRIDVAAIAAATSGATGADLRELFRHALLATEEPLSTRSLLAAARESGLAGGSDHGTYL